MSDSGAGSGTPAESPEASGGAPSEADTMVAAFVSWAAEQRAGEAAAARSRERWLRQQAAESATWLGVLVDLAERRAEAVVSVGGRHLGGRIVAVGPDVCVLADPTRPPVVVALAHVRAVRVLRTTAPAAGARYPELHAGLAGALAALAADRAVVVVVAAGGERVRGELVGAGADVVTVRAGGACTYLPVAAIETCTPSR